MLSMTSLQLLVVLLSALHQVQPTNNDVDKLTTARVTDTTVATCADRDEIARWINEQVMRNAKLTRFNQRIGQLLNSLNSNVSEQVQEEHCCFYEKNSMDTIFADLQSISGKNQIDGEPLKPSGDIGKDLDSILERMKKIVAQDFKTCCNQLSEDLKELKSNLTNQLENLNQQLNASHEIIKVDKEELQKNQTELENEQNKLTKLIDQLENKEKQIEAKFKEETCCEKLSKEFKDLSILLEAAKTETQTKADKLENELEEMQKIQEKHEIGLKDIKEVLAKSENNLKVVQATCEKECNMLEKDLDDNENKTQNSMSNDLIFTKFENLEKTLKELHTKTEHLTQFNVSLFERIDKRLLIAHKHVQNITDLHNKHFADHAEYDKNIKNNCCVCQDANENDTESNSSNINNNDNSKLPQTIEIARNCCTNIDHLTETNKELRKDIENQDSEHKQKINELTEDLKTIQNRLEVLQESEKIEKLHSSQAESQMSDSIKQLQEELAKIEATLPANEAQLNNNSNKLKEVEQYCNNKFKELTDLMEKKANEVKLTENNIPNHKDEHKVPTENNINKQLFEILQRLGYLIGRYEELDKDVNKVMQLEQRIENLEHKLDNALSQLADSEDHLSLCYRECKKLDNIDDMIDRIEDLEHGVINGIKRPATKSPTGSVDGFKNIG